MPPGLWVGVLLRNTPNNVRRKTHHNVFREGSGEKREGGRRTSLCDFVRALFAGGSLLPLALGAGGTK